MTLQQRKLPLNLEDLLRARTVESDPIEYKADWNSVHDDLTETELKILWFLQAEPQGRAAFAKYLGLKSHSGPLYRSIEHLRGVGVIELISIVRETTVGIALFPAGRVQGDGAGKQTIISRTMLSHRADTRKCG